MATFPASSESNAALPPPFAYASRIAARHARVRRQTIVDPDSTVTSLNPPGGSTVDTLEAVSHVPAPPARQEFPACREDRTGFGFDWFEKFHVFPGSFILGNVLSTQQIPVDVYSAYRQATHDWDGFTNNAGAGVSLLNQPSYSYSFVPQTGYSGLLLEVTANGPPTVDSTLDFIFSTMTISPVIQLERLLLFDLPPEADYTELLGFLTEIQPHLDGGEHRLGLRKSPRQEFEWDLVLEDSHLRSRIHNLLFNWQAYVFGVPVWHEATFASAAISATDTTINVRSTAYADYREGGLVLVYESSSKFDVMEVDVGGITGTTLTFTNGVQNAYTTRALVMPLRTGVLGPSVPGTRLITDAGRLRARFLVKDNDASLASTSGWDTYGGKVVLNDVNSAGGGNSVEEELLRDVIVLDNGVGAFSLDTLWAQSKRRHTKTFWARTPEELWSVRQLLWALRGRQVSFYLPTKGSDLTPTANLLSGGATLTVRNVGYARHVQNRQTRNVIQVHFNNGDPPLVREVISSAEVDPDTETLTTDSTWPSTYTPSEVDRIEYLELTRFDSDDIRFQYNLGERTCRISAPTITVFDE